MSSRPLFTRISSGAIRAFAALVSCCLLLPAAVMAADQAAQAEKSEQAAESTQTPAQTSGQGSGQTTQTTQPAQADPAAQAEEVKIRIAFSALQAALNANDSTAAVALLSTDTKEYYGLLARIVRRNSKKEIESLDPMNRIMVDSVKKFIPPEVLKKKDPSELLKAAIDRGLTARDIKKDLALADIETKGDRGLAGLTSQGKPIVLRLGFTRENGGWKVNLLTLIEQTNLLTEAMIEKLHISKEDWVKSTESRMKLPKDLPKAPKTQARVSSARKASVTD